MLQKEYICGARMRFSLRRVRKQGRGRQLRSHVLERG